MKLLINMEEMDNIPLIKFRPSENIVLSRLYGFNLNYSHKVELQPVYKPILILSKTKRNIRIEMFNWRVIFMTRKPFIYKEKL